MLVKLNSGNKMNIGVKKMGVFYGLLIIGFIIGSTTLTLLQKKEWGKYTTITYDSKLIGEVIKIRVNRGTSFEFKNGQKFFFQIQIISIIIHLTLGALLI